MLDIFKNDAFGSVSLTDAFIKRPYKPGLIGALGWFKSRGINTKTASIEWKNGKLSLIQSSERGSEHKTIGKNKRKLIAVDVPHLKRDGKIYADEIQGVRTFGAESNELETAQTKVNEILSDLRGMHEVTLEYHRLGAIKGQVLDADGSTLVDWFDELAVTQQTYVFDFSTSAEEARRQCMAITRLSEDELGGEMVSGYRAFCGDDFFDNLLDSDSVRETLKYQEGQVLREDMRKGFLFGGILWTNYRGRVAQGDEDNATMVDFIESDEAYVAPEADIYRTYYAPATFLETVNTIGLPLYAKIVEDKDLNEWVKVHTQSNPLSVNLRPRSVIKLTMTT